MAAEHKSTGRCLEMLLKVRVNAGCFLEAFSDGGKVLQVNIRGYPLIMLAMEGIYLPLANERGQNHVSVTNQQTLVQL